MVTDESGPCVSEVQKRHDVKRSPVPTCSEMQLFAFAGINLVVYGVDVLVSFFFCSMAWASKRI